MNDERISTLTLVAVRGQIEWLSPVSPRDEQSFFDFAIDGIALRSLLGTEDTGVLSNEVRPSHEVSPASSTTMRRALGITSRSI